MKAPTIRIRRTETIPRSFHTLSGVDIGIYALGGVRITESAHVANRLDRYVRRYGGLCGVGKVNGRPFVWIIRAYVGCQSLFHE